MMSNGINHPAGGTRGRSWTAMCAALLVFASLVCPVRLPAQAPVITSVVPSSGAPGTPVTISGSSFDPVPGNNTVMFGGVRAAVVSTVPGELHVTVPAGAGYGPVIVTVGGLTARSAVSFDITFSSAGVFDTASLAVPVMLNGGVFPSRGLAVGDLDGDGKPDLVISAGGESVIGIYRNISTPGSLTAESFGPRITLPTPLEPYKLVLADLDGDGKPDIAVVNHGYGSGTTCSIYRNISTPDSIAFDARIDVTTPASGTAIDAGDFNLDGKTDLVVSSYGTDSCLVLVNNSTPGNISFQPGVTFYAGPGCFDVTVADIDGDGKPDIVTAEGQIDAIGVFRNVSSGSVVDFAPRVDFTGGAIATSLLAADLNRDGKPEIIAGNYFFGTINVYHNTAVPGVIDASSFGRVDTLPAGDVVRGLSAGDIDGDGKTDIVTANYSGSTISVIRNTSSADGISFAPTITTGSGASPISCAVADIDGDGRPEIVAGNNQDHTLAVFRNLLGDHHPITASAGPHGSIDPPGTVEVLHQADQAFTVSPSIGYVIAGVRVDSVPAGNISSYTFRHVIGPHTISATFTPQMFVITSSAGPHGSIAPADSTVIEYGTDQLYTFTPEQGYHVDSLFVDGLPVPPAASFLFSTVREPHSIRVTFSIDLLTVTASAGPHGTIIPSGPVIVPYGGDTIFTFVPGKGYVIDSVIVSGVYHGRPGQYRIRNVTGDSTIRVTFGQSTVAWTTVSGWNLISLPVVPTVDSAAVLFPGARSRAFAYRNTYVVSDTLAVGSGYWLKFGAPSDVHVSGIPVEADSIPVTQGWNLIGSVVSPVAVNTITGTPEGLGVSQFFGYDVRYNKEDTIRPGVGYWVKADRPGTLLLNSGGGAMIAKAGWSILTLRRTGENPPAPPEETDARGSGVVPVVSSLGRNFPNPFNPATTVSFDIGSDRGSSIVSLKVYDLLGREIATLVNGRKEAGRYSVVWDASGLGSGVYYCRLEIRTAADPADVFTGVRKMVLMR